MHRYEFVTSAHFNTSDGPSWNVEFAATPKPKQLKPSSPWKQEELDQVAQTHNQSKLFKSAVQKNLKPVQKTRVTNESEIQLCGNPNENIQKGSRTSFDLAMLQLDELLANILLDDDAVKEMMEWRTESQPSIADTANSENLANDYKDLQMKTSFSEKSLESDAHIFHQAIGDYVNLGYFRDTPEPIYAVVRKKKKKKVGEEHVTSLYCQTSPTILETSEVYNSSPALLTSQESLNITGSVGCSEDPGYESLDSIQATIKEHWWTKQEEGNLRGNKLDEKINNQNLRLHELRDKDITDSQKYSPTRIPPTTIPNRNTTLLNKENLIRSRECRPTFGLMNKSTQTKAQEDMDNKADINAQPLSENIVVPTKMSVLGPNNSFRNRGTPLLCNTFIRVRQDEHSDELQRNKITLPTDEARRNATMSSGSRVTELGVVEIMNPSISSQEMIEKDREPVCCTGGMGTSLKQRKGDGDECEGNGKRRIRKNIPMSLMRYFERSLSTKQQHKGKDKSERFLSHNVIFGGLNPVN